MLQEGFPGAPDDEPMRASSILEAVTLRGAAISTIGGFLTPETLSATDETIARIDELQLDLGEGPCWDAVSSGRPVREPALLSAPRHVWPAFTSAVAEHGVGALFAIPLTVGPLTVGAIDLYDLEPGETDLTGAIALAAQLSRQVLRRAIRLVDVDEHSAVGNRYSRRAIHQATGFVIAQVGVSAEDAELLIRARAFAEGRTMNEVAEDVLHGRRVFSTDGTAIEDAQ